MKKLICLLVTLAACIPPAAAQTVAGAFSKGRFHFAITGGPGYAFDEDYIVIGAGVSYYVIDGLSVGFSAETWTGGDPGMYKLTPSVQYVFYRAPVKPYVGAFYRRTSIERLPDLDSVGGRAGIQFQSTPNAYLGVGLVYESYLDCSESTFRECDSLYGELSFTFAF